VACGSHSRTCSSPRTRSTTRTRRDTCPRASVASTHSAATPPVRLLLFLVLLSINYIFSPPWFQKERSDALPASSAKPSAPPRPSPSKPSPVRTDPVAPLATTLTCTFLFSMFLINLGCFFCPRYSGQSASSAGSAKKPAPSTPLSRVCRNPTHLRLLLILIQKINRAQL